VLVSTSRQETFGLAILEGLACGLPVLYGACPPLEEWTGPPVPGARRLADDPQALPRVLRAELAAIRERRQARLPVPAVVGHFDVARQADSIDRLYAGLMKEGNGR
jgi:glycosyltransferase involved in cell wall biosynthesis